MPRVTVENSLELLPPSDTDPGFTKHSRENAWTEKSRFSPIHALAAGVSTTERDRTEDQCLDSETTYEQLHRTHARRLALYVLQWLPCRSDAEDVVQDVFIRFWPRLPDVSHPVSYLYRSARNAAHNWSRGAHRREEAERRRTPERLFDDPPGDLEEEEFRVRVETALRSLSSAQREIVTLRLWADLSFPEISETLGIPVATAKSRYRSSLEALRRTQMGAAVEE